MVVVGEVVMHIMGLFFAWGCGAASMDTGMDSAVGLFDRVEPPQAQAGLCFPGNPQLGGYDLALFGADSDPLALDGYPVVVTVHGGFEAEWEGAIQIAWRPRGFIQVYMDLPEDDRGQDSRRFLADVIRYVAGRTTDDQGCTFAQRAGVPLSWAFPIILGQSNGGNLVLVTLASIPGLPVSGLIAYEMPFGAQFVAFELGAPDRVNPGYQRCSWGPMEGMECLVDVAPVWNEDLSSVLFEDYTVPGLPTLEGPVMFSKGVIQEIVPSGAHANLSAAREFWRMHDGSLWIPEISENYPDLRVISLGTETDHASGVPDHSHVSGIVSALVRMGIRAQVNPAPRFMGILGRGAEGWSNNPIPRFPGDPAIQMEPDEEFIGLDSTDYIRPAVLDMLSP